MLSFARRYADGHTNHWSPTRTGDYATDFAIGRAAGLEVVDRLRDGAEATVLRNVIRDMIAADQFDGVEIGFCAALTERVR